MAGWIDVIASKAPLLGAVLGSPVAGIGLSLLANAFGVSTTDVDSISRAVLSNPDADRKLAEIEATHSIALAQLVSADYATEVDDRKNARLREVTLHDHVPFILAIIFVVIYALVQFTAVFYPTPGEDLISARVQDIMVMIIGYFFGSSAKQRIKPI
jgi:hypothetical protein